MTPHAIVVLPKTDGMEMLLCYEDEGVYVNTYGRITKDVVLQWGEMPTSVGESVFQYPSQLCKKKHTDQRITSILVIKYLSLVDAYKKTAYFAVLTNISMILQWHWFPIGLYRSVCLC